MMSSESVRRDSDYSPSDTKPAIFCSTKNHAVEGTTL